MLCNDWSTQHDICPSHVCAYTTVRTDCIMCFCLNGRVAESGIRIGVIILSCQLESTGEKPVASVAGRINSISEIFKLLFSVLGAAARVCPFYAIKFWHFKASHNRTLPNPPFTVNIPTVISDHEVEEYCALLNYYTDVVAVSCRSFGTNYRSHIQGSSVTI